MSKRNLCNVLILGETGAGKSTFINYLANYFHDGTVNADDKFDKLKIVIPNKQFPTANLNLATLSEDNINDPTVSKTTKSTIFKFRKDNVEFNFLDTPGLGDTRGTKQDDENIKNILGEVFKLGMISAIILVVNGTVARKTTALSYCLSRIKGNLPDSILNNLIVVLTNTDENGSNFDVSLLDGIETENIFKMDNNAFSNNDVNRRKNAWRSLENDWETSMETIGEIKDLLLKLNVQSTNDFYQMRANRENLQRETNSLVMKQMNLLDTIEAIELHQKAATEQAAKMDANKNFTTQVKQKIWKTVKQNYYSTVCQTHFKEKICHEQCGVPFSETINASHFSGCACHNGSGNCSVCACTIGIHFHTYEIPSQVEETIEQILSDKKAMYENSKNQLSKITSEKDQLEAIKQASLADVKKHTNEIKNACQNLKQICRNFNFAEEMGSFIKNLEMQSKTATNLTKKNEYQNMANAIKSIMQL